MSDQLLPDFDGPGNQPDEVRPGPKKPRRKPAKKVVKRGPPPAKRVPKKRRARKVGKHPALAASYGSQAGITPGVDSVWSGRSSEALGMLLQLPVAARKLVITVALALTK